MSKKQCAALLPFDPMHPNRGGSYCVKPAGHMFAHRTYRGRVFTDADLRPRPPSRPRLFTELLITAVLLFWAGILLSFY